jgi:dihydroorotase
MHSIAKITPWDGRQVQGLPLHTIVRGRFVMKDRLLQPGTRGWGRSVHEIQNMPAPVPVNLNQTTAAILAGRT